MAGGTLAVTLAVVVAMSPTYGGLEETDGRYYVNNHGERTELSYKTYAHRRTSSVRQPAGLTTAALLVATGAGAMYRRLRDGWQVQAERRPKAVRRWSWGLSEVGVGAGPMTPAAR